MDFAKIKAAVRDLVHDLLTHRSHRRLRAREEDAGRAGRAAPAAAAALERLKDIPTDIEPVHVTALEVAPNELFAKNGS